MTDGHIMTIRNIGYMMGIKERRKREIQSRKDEILNAAEYLFQKQGYENTTMDEIAKEAELSKGTLYLYYKTKEELYLRICVKALKIMFELFKDASSDGSTGLGKVQLVGQAYIKFAVEFPYYYDSQLHFESRKFENIANYQISQEHIEITTKINMIVFNAVEEGINDGSIRSDLQPEMTGLMLWAFSNGFIKFVIKNEDEFKDYFSSGREHVIKSFFDLLLNGLKS
jgi:AcrR family transcriptional regulator